MHGFHISRRQFLKMGSVALPALWLPGCMRSEPGRTLNISVLHSTDLHAHILPTMAHDGTTNVGGFARVATQLKRWQRANPNHLLVDAGDLYQGTAVGHATEGDVMVRCLNHFGYDCWVAGNHEFDWGLEPFQRAVAHSKMPVLAANLRMFGQDPLPTGRAGNGFDNLRPCMVKEVAGIRIGIVGLITTGIFNWFPRDLLAGLEVLDPIAPTRAAIRWLRHEGHCDVILLVCHMGVRPGRHFDDHANHVVALTREFPELVAVIGAHSHQLIPYDRVNTVPYTQANHHGIHVGRCELQFDPDTRRLLAVQPTLELMDARIEQDASVLALVGDDLAQVEAELNRPVGVLAQPLDIVKPGPGQPSDLELFIYQSLSDRLRTRGHTVDAVFHGLLFQRAPIQAGTLTVRDMWTIMPFENYIVLADLTPAELAAIVDEDLSRGGSRSLMGLQVDIGQRGQNWVVNSLRGLNGGPLNPDKRLTVAFNSYDSASGGLRLPLLRDILQSSSSNRRLLRLQSRALVTEYFQDQQIVHLRR